MKYLLLILLLPTIAYSQVIIYAGPSGSAGAAGTYADPYDITTGMAKASRMDTILQLKGGKYTAPATMGRSGRRTQIRAVSGERPLLQTSGGYAPSVTLSDSTTVIGVWFGGPSDPDTSQRHGTIVMSKADSLDGCVFWGHDKGVISAASPMDRVLNCLFVRNVLNSSWSNHEHVLYMSDSNNGDWNQRDIVYRNVSIKAPDGYVWHFYHYESNYEVKRNFSARGNNHGATSGNLRDDGKALINCYWRDNIYWSNDSGYVNPARGEVACCSGNGIDARYFVNSAGGSQKWPTHDLIGKGIGQMGGDINQASFTAHEWQSGPPAGYGDSCTWISPNTWPAFANGTNATSTTDTALPRLIGKTQAQMDSAVVRLERYFTKPNDSVLVNTNIQTEWNVILSALDTWAGESGVTQYTITASAGANGSISPSGAVSVDSADTQAFTMTADGGYHLESVTVDGSPAAVSSPYTFTNVVANHTISCTFHADAVSSTRKVIIKRK